MGSLRFAHGAGFMGWFITTNSQDLLHHKQNIFDKILNLKENLMMFSGTQRKPKRKQTLKKEKCSIRNLDFLGTKSVYPMPRSCTYSPRLHGLGHSFEPWEWFKRKHHDAMVSYPAVCPKICTPFNLVKAKNCEIWIPCLQNHTFRYPAIVRHTNSVFLTLTRPKAPQRFRSSSLS